MSELLRLHAGRKGETVKPYSGPIVALCGNHVNWRFIMSKRKREKVTCKACLKIMEDL